MVKGVAALMEFKLRILAEEAHFSSTRWGHLCSSRCPDCSCSGPRFANSLDELVASLWEGCCHRYAGKKSSLLERARIEAGPARDDEDAGAGAHDDDIAPTQRDDDNEADQWQDNPQSSGHSRVALQGDRGRSQYPEAPWARRREAAPARSTVVLQPRPSQKRPPLSSSGVQREHRKQQRADRPRPSHAPARSSATVIDVPDTELDEESEHGDPGASSAGRATPSQMQNLVATLQSLSSQEQRFVRDASNDLLAGGDGAGPVQDYLGHSGASSRAERRDVAQEHAAATHESHYRARTPERERRDSNARAARLLAMHDWPQHGRSTELPALRALSVSDVCQRVAAKKRSFSWREYKGTWVFAKPFALNSEIDVPPSCGDNWRRSEIVLREFPDGTTALNLEVRSAPVSHWRALDQGVVLALVLLWRFYKVAEYEHPHDMCTLHGLTLLCGPQSPKGGMQLKTWKHPYVRTGQARCGPLFLLSVSCASLCSLVRPVRQGLGWCVL